MGTCAHLLDLPEDILDVQILQQLTKNSLLYESFLSFRCTCLSACRLPQPSALLGEKYRRFVRLHYDRSREHLRISPDNRDSVLFLAYEFFSGTFDRLVSLRIEPCRMVRTELPLLLTAIFSSMSTVQHLSIFDTQIGDSNFGLVSTHSLSCASKLRRLSLHGNRLTEVSILRISMIRLAGMLPAMVELDLQYNMLFDAGIRTLASCGRDSLRSLSYLNIASNHISNAGIAHLARHLLEAGTHGCFPLLRFLDMGFNIISDYGALLMAHAGAVDFVLPQCKILLLNGNTLGFHGASEIARTLRAGGMASLEVIGCHQSILTRNVFVQHYE